MAESCFPYNSVSGDRTYKAEDFRAYFSQLIGNGVIYKTSEALKVRESDGMDVVISAGGAWIEGVGYINSSTLTLTLDTADGSLSRIDRIVIRNDYTNRKTYADVLKGSYSASPTATALTRDADVYEIALADVLVAGGVVSITQSNITDTRLDGDLCGIVTAIIEQADTTEIFDQFETYLTEFKAQYIEAIENWTEIQEASLENWETEQKAAFEAWVETIKSILDEEVAGHLQLEIEAINESLDAFKAEIEATVEAEITKIEAAQKGFDSKTTVFNSDGSITETDGSGYKVVTEFNSDGSILQTLYLNDENQATKTTVFNDDGSIDETAEWVTEETA